MVVVMITFSTLMPVHEAAAQVVVHGGLIALVIALLVACGMVFASPMEAVTVANDAITSMPATLLAELAGAISRMEPPKSYNQISNGFVAAAALTTATYLTFKAWFKQHFGVDDAAAEAGEVEVSDPADALVSGDAVELPYGVSYAGRVIHPDVINHVNSMRYRHVTVTWSPQSQEIILFGSPSPLYMDENGMTIYGSFSRYWRADGSLHGPVSGSVLTFSSLGTEVAVVVYCNYDMYDSKGVFLHPPVNRFSGISKTYGINAGAYGYAGPDTDEPIDLIFGLPGAGVGEDIPAWDEVITNHDGINRWDSIPENWDYPEDLDHLEDFFKGISEALGIGNDLAFPEIAAKFAELWEAVDAMKAGVEAGTASAVGGVEELNRLMVQAHQAAWALQQAMAAGQAAAAEQVAALQAELEAAKEAIREALKEGTQNPPDVPGKPNIPGKINWGLLLNLAIFRKFPFSIPFDVHLFVSALAAPPKKPVFEMDIFPGMFDGAGKFTLDLTSLTEFERIRSIVRNGFLILYVIGLMGATRKYIWSGGG